MIKKKIKLIHYPERENDELLEILSSLNFQTQSKSEVIEL